MSEYLVTVGNCKMGTEDQSGLSLFRFQEIRSDNGTAALEARLLWHGHDEIIAGQQLYDGDRKILYVVDERMHQYKQFGGGGNVFAFRVHEDRLELMNSQRTYGVNPCYLALDKNTEFLVVAQNVLADLTEIDIEVAAIFSSILFL